MARLCILYTMGLCVRPCVGSDTESDAESDPESDRASDSLTQSLTPAVPAGCPPEVTLSTVAAFCCSGTLAGRTAAGCSDWVDQLRFTVERFSGRRGGGVGLRRGRGGGGVLGYTDGVHCAGSHRSPALVTRLVRDICSFGTNNPMNKIESNNLQ